MSARNAGDLGSIPGSGRSPGEGNGNLLQYSCLETPTDRAAWWATVHRVTRSRTRLSDFTFFLYFLTLLLNRKVLGPPDPPTPVTLRPMSDVQSLAERVGFTQQHLGSQFTSCTSQSVLTQEVPRKGPGSSSGPMNVLWLQHLGKPPKPRAHPSARTLERPFGGRG